MLEAVAAALGPDLLERTVFVGGATTGLFVTDDFTMGQVRLTDDVDLITDIMGQGRWAEFEELLRTKGFRNSQEDGIICRMLLGDLKVDFMPDDAAILGFTNRWYALGLETAQDHALSDTTTIRLLTPALFVATKLEAYLGRGDGDPIGSRDIEDILIMLDGRKELIVDTQGAPDEVQKYIAEQLSSLLGQDQFENTVLGNVRGDTERAALVFQRIQDITALGQTP